MLSRTTCPKRGWIARWQAVRKENEMTLAILGTLLMHAVELPMGPAPEPLALPHFPDRLHACVWRNWTLVPPARLGEVVGATEEQILALGKSMGLDAPPAISEEQWRRSYITIIRRNWHILPYDQLLTLLDWTAEEMAYTLREDDFLYIKLGSLKPKCEPLRYAAPSGEAPARAAEIAAIVKNAFPAGAVKTDEPLFGFIAALSEPPESPRPLITDSAFSPRFCSSYFTMYGDPFLEKEADSLPEGYLARLAESGVDGVWMQGVLYKLTPFPWDPEMSTRYEERLDTLAEYVARARKHGVGIYLYLNEPRAMPLAFFDDRPELKGVIEGDYAAMCTSAPEVRDYIRNAVKMICERVPDLAGFFTISGSENLTNCWSHHRGNQCERCGKRLPAEVIAEFNSLIPEGIAAAGGKARFIAWDWGWNDEWIEGIVERLPSEVSIQSVSEWSIPINRGGIDTAVGEYSISVVGPGPRATRTWGFARDRGLRRIAKIQANNTWELSSVPYIPAVENVAQHASNLRKADVNGLMLGWTLGGCPSPNLEVVAEMARGGERSVDEVMTAVAVRRHGPELAPAVVEAWRTFSAAFREFPYHGGLVYSAPQQMGPANLLWGAPTGYRATMVGIPYDDLNSWRAVYPPEVFVGQFSRVADGFDAALAGLKAASEGVEIEARFKAALAHELDVMEVCAIHYHSVANQGRFVMARDALAAATTPEAGQAAAAALEEALRSEIGLATRLFGLQSRDSRFGFEASNHYFYVPIDLAEKVINCEDLLSRWLPAERAKRGF